jgi:plastocyanin
VILLRTSRLLLIAIAGALLAVWVGAADADAPPPSTASFTAQDYSWTANGTAAHSATIAMGGTVSFAYPSGGSTHNAHFEPSVPTSCAGLPADPAAPGWSGTCTFDTAGTYAFHCQLHTDMVGTVVVVDPNAPPPTTTTTPPTTTTTPTTTHPSTTPTTTRTTTSTSTQPGTPGTVPTTPTGSNPYGGGDTGTPTTPGSSSARPPALTVARSQHGTLVRGTLKLTRRGDVTVTLTIRQSGRTVTVGHVVVHGARAGKRTFSVKLNAAGRRALKRHGRLTVSVRARSTGGPSGAARSVTLRTG